MTRKASEDELADLHGVLARGLTTVLRDGVATDIGTVTAPAAYFMAGITLLKNNNITADAGQNEDLQALSRALSEKRNTRKDSLMDMRDTVKYLERDLGADLE